MNQPQDGPVCTLLPWDSEFWGFRVGRVTTEVLTPAIRDTVDDWSRACGVRCLYFLARADEAQTVAIAQSDGFRLVDVRVTLEARLDRGTATPDDRPGTLVRPFEPRDGPALEAIAGTAHQATRFYFDGRFPRARCHQLYQEWIRRSYRGHADTVLVAEADGRAVGYASLLRGVEPRMASIDLLAVDASARGKGVGVGLVAAALTWFGEREVGTARVVTQGRNVAAQALYQTCGFRTSDLKLWYHKWYDASEALEVVAGVREPAC